MYYVIQVLILKHLIVKDFFLIGRHFYRGLIKNADYVFDSKSLHYYDVVLLQKLHQVISIIQLYLLLRSYY